MDYKVHNKLNEEFLERFPLEKLKDMTLEQYTNLNRSDSFCYWVEFKTNSLGGVRGGDAFKFGIYRYNQPPKYKPNTLHDDKYAWNSKLGTTATEAFENVKKIVISVAESGRKADLDAIEKIRDLFSMIKWKIAFLYSNETIVPYYSIDRLRVIAEKMGMSISNDTTLADIQKFLIDNRTDEDIHVYGKKLNNIWKEYKNDGASTRDTAKEPSPIKYGMSYWIYSPGENASKWQECQEEGIMCIGWDELGDLSEYDSREEVRSEIKNYYPTDGNAKNDSLAVWQFANEMKPGDIVFAKKGLTKIIGRGVVQSDYVFDENRDDFKHIRKVEWTHVGEWVSTEQSAMKTLTNITKYKDYVDRLNNLIDGNKTATSKDSTGKQYWWLTGSPKYWSPSKNWELGEDIDYTLYNERGNKRRVFKHFLEAKPGDLVIAYESTPKLQIVALGRVVSETDGEVLYIRKTEELLSPIPYDDIQHNPLLKTSEPVMNRSQGSLFKLTQDEYDEIMRLVRKDNPEPVVEDEEDDDEEYALYWDEDFLKEVYMNEKDYERLKGLLLRKKNLILQGAPGVGKTFAAKRLAYAIMGEKNDNRVKIVQFHQNYSYEDFVLGYKPNEFGGFELKEGIFYQFCKKAATDKDNEYFFIIDEINRGNLSKIFGELLMMIEKEYRNTPVQMSYADRRFTVPSNVYLIGMMNTADRSLAMIDYALRRRFSFFEMKPAFDNAVFKYNIIKKHDTHLDKLVNALKDLNKVIAEDDSLGTGFCIGHSYLCDLGDDYDLESIVEYDIIPMLREYWFDNDDRFNKEAQKLREAIK